MKQIKLLNMKLSHFKGIKDLEIDFNGDDTRIYGENGTGKTTVFDAFVWLLFNKDSNNNSNFDIKTLDNDGNVIHRLDHEVEATLLIDGKETTLKKVYKEKWTRHRSAIEETFSGHTTDYYINGVPSKKKEYDEFIKTIVDEDIFQLLTNPSYFNKVLHWTKRRELLLEVAGDITDEDVIASNKDLEELSDLLKDHNIDDLKKIIAAKRREVNKAIEEIPTRIDEIHRNLPDTSNLDREKIEANIDKLSAEIEKQENEIQKIRLGTATNDLKRQVSDLELKIAKVKNSHEQNEQNELFKLKARLQEEESNQNIMRNELKSLNQQKKSNEERIKDFEKQMDELRKEYVEENAKEFDHEANCKCPTCEQELPQEQVTEIATKFNVDKSNKLEEINKRGIRLKEQAEELKSDNEKLQKKIDKVTENGTKKTKDIEKLKADIEKAQNQVKPIEENVEYIKLNDEKKALEQRINELDQSVEQEVAKVKEGIDKLKEQQRELQTDLASIVQAEGQKERIAELENEEKALAKEYEELNRQLHLTEEFTRIKVDLLTENINNKFKYARFNLFEEQVNGGLKEICETTFDGVPYGSGLNNAAKINVGLDIINTLSKHYGVQAPIFVDNAESVTRLIDVDAQVISLIVSGQDKALRIEQQKEEVAV